MSLVALAAEGVRGVVSTFSKVFSQKTTGIIPQSTVGGILGPIGYKGDLSDHWLV